MREKGYCESGDEVIESFSEDLLYLDCTPDPLLGKIGAPRPRSVNGANVEAD